MIRSLLTLFLLLGPATSFSPSTTPKKCIVGLHFADRTDWIGDVVSNNSGKIKGCSIRQVEGSLVDWIIQIDGVEADLGKFSEAVYKKVTSDVKKQRFQGFRPGTIPPHLIVTYKAFTMDEVCRETTLEAMEQNNIRPFDGCREGLTFESFSIPPVKPKRQNQSTSKKNRKQVINDESETLGSDVTPDVIWKSYDTMKEAIEAGWQPGQSFSFLAKNVRGQKTANSGAPMTNPLSNW